MCSPTVIQFGTSQLLSDEITNKKVIEVGAANINGSLREIIKRFNPLTYLGVDIFEGNGVDEICDINNLVSHFSKESFDVVICTEVFEHVRDYRNAASNIKNLLCPNGVLLLTTRSKGFPYHGYPFDFWRYEIEDISLIFGDLIIEANYKDPSLKYPGVFLKARKPKVFNEKSLKELEIFSIIKKIRCKDISDFEFLLFRMMMTIRRFIFNLLPSRFEIIGKMIVLKLLTRLSEK